MTMKNQLHGVVTLFSTFEFKSPFGISQLSLQQDMILPPTIKQTQYGTDCDRLRYDQMCNYDLRKINDK